MARTPLPMNTSSNTVVNFAVAIPDQESEQGGALAEIHEKVTGLLGGPRPGGVGRDAQDVHAPGLDLHHEQDVQALEEHGVNSEVGLGRGSAR